MELDTQGRPRCDGLVLKHRLQAPRYEDGPTVSHRSRLLETQGRPVFPLK